jgi:hypothetical protein
MLVLSRATGWATITTFNVSGNQTWTCPAGVTTVTVECWGGGGGGGGCGANYTLAGGGAGGSYVRYTMTVTPSTVYQLTVGAAGSAGSSSGGNGGTGGSSYFGNTTAGISSGASVLAVGGPGGSGNSTSGGATGTRIGGAAGGTATTSGNLPSSGAAANTAGTSGGTSIGGTSTQSSSGAGGAGAGSTGSAGGGAGGTVQASSNNNGKTGTAPGGGGSGGYQLTTAGITGGVGGAGQVAITYAQTYTWISGSAWLTAGNWNPSSGPPTNIDTAIFDGTSSSSPGIAMSTAGGAYSVGEIQLTGGANRTINNSSTTTAGTLTVNGINNVALQNSSTFILTFANGSSQNMPVAFGNSGESVDITSSGGITISSVITGGNGFTKTGSGSGILTLSGANTYSGDTTISGGTLALLGSSTIPATSVSLTVAGGAIFDVSATAGFTMDSAQTLKASGNGSTGTIKTTSTSGLTLGTTSGLQFTAYDGSTPPLTLSGNGMLTLQTGNPVTVTVNGSALGAGDYKLIAKGASGTVSGTPSSVMINGTGGLAANTVASLMIVAGELYLHVASTAGCTSAPNTPGTITQANPSGSTVCSSSSGVTYTIAPVSGATDYTWTVPSGGIIQGTATGPSITVNYSGATSGNVTVTANNACGNSSAATFAVTVDSSAPATPGTITQTGGATSTSVCANSAGITYSIAVVSGATSYTWTVPTGASITAGQGTTSITVNWGTAASGNVTVTADDPCGSSSAATLAVTVNPTAVSVTVSANPGTTICAGTPVTFTATPVNGGSTPSYQWKKNGSNVGTDSASYTDAGLVNSDQIQVTLTSSATCAAGPANSSTITMTVNTYGVIVISQNFGTTINAAPPTGWSVAGSPTWTIDTGSASSGYGGASGGANAEALGTVATDATIVTPIIDFSGLANGVLTFGVRGTATWTRSLVVEVSIDGGATFTAFSQTLSSGLNAATYNLQTINLGSTIDNKSQVQIRWRVAGSPSSGPNLRIDDVRLVSATSASITGPASFCQGGSAVLTASPGSSYIWSTTETTRSITVNSANTYSVTIFDADGCSSPANQTVTVNPLPTANNATYAETKGQTFKIAVSDLLTHASSGATLNNVSGTSASGANMAFDSTYVYYFSQLAGNDSFTYTVNSPSDCTSAAGTVSITAVVPGGVAQNITYSGGAVTINFAGIPGYQYEIQRSASMDFSSYDVLSTVTTPDSGLFSYTDNNPLQPNGFYRTMRYFPPNP